MVITGPYLPVVCLLGVVLKDVGQPLWGEDLLPEVGRLHPVGVNRVAGAAVLLTLVEGQEIRGIAFQFGAKLHFFIVDRKVDGAPAQPEEVLLWTSGGFVLFHGIGDGLACEPVLELHRGDGEAVHEEGDIQRQLLVAGAVPELPGDGKPVLTVSFLSLGVAGAWCSVEECYLVRSVLDTLPEYVNDAPVAYLPFEAVQEPSSRGGICVQSQCSRCFRLGSREKGGEVAEVDAVGAFVVLRVAGEPSVAG